MLKSRSYDAWLTNTISYLWLNAQPGGGKTVLCSTIIEDLKQCFMNHTEIALGFFCFAFDHSERQSYYSLLRSLVAQLVKSDKSSIARLQEAYNSRISPRTHELEELLLCLSRHKQVYIDLDALDECPEHDDARETMLARLKTISNKGSNIELLMTSRIISDIRYSMKELGAEELSIARKDVDRDIRRFLSTQMARHERLSNLSSDVKERIGVTIVTKSDGM